MRPTYQLYDIWKITTQVWDYSVEPIACNVIQSLIYEAAKRGHTVAITTGKNLTIRDNVAYAFCQVVVKSNKVSNKVPTFYRQVAFRKRMLPLGGFDAIIMRDNPPLDPTVLNFLDSVKEGTFIMNDIDGLRIANNKIYTASFGDDAKKFIPSTHVSRNRDYLERVLEESDSGSGSVFSSHAGR